MDVYIYIRKYVKEIENGRGGGITDRAGKLRLLHGGSLKIAFNRNGQSLLVIRGHYMDWGATHQPQSTVRSGPPYVYVLLYIDIDIYVYINTL